ncbi:expressed unknown protein [Seminavis robusta]|uniref:Hedgehog protein Hint domain-containing protein n=1 Tax=Seminavis robusta TaxID=568900 RepID=A0A9N8DCV9_9STRA|nr:expressed unknown protein [Seminavis robusta]|eukprot:Sro95_g049221.1  (292) ;mRNA; r:34389-35264
MKITSLPLFTITTMALLAMAQGDAVCHTVNAVAVPTPIIETISVLTGTTNVICDLSCDGSVNVNSRLVVAGMIDSGTSTCGGSISSNIFEDLTLSYSANGNMNVVITCTCIGAGNPAPTPPASSCFSEQATVEQPGQAPTKMTDLKIGDMVLTANKKFEPVYAFAHNDATTDTEFLQIHTTSGKNKKPIGSHWSAFGLCAGQGCSGHSQIHQGWDSSQSSWTWTRRSCPCHQDQDCPAPRNLCSSDSGWHPCVDGIAPRAISLHPMVIPKPWNYKATLRPLSLTTMLLTCS